MLCFSSSWTVFLRVSKPFCLAAPTQWVSVRPSGGCPWLNSGLGSVAIANSVRSGFSFGMAERSSGLSGFYGSVKPLFVRWTICGGRQASRVWFSVVGPHGWAAVGVFCVLKFGRHFIELRFQTRY